ncbi:MAG: hypothetical protein ACI8S6_004875, partial [Myxococcota bacterium]
MMSRSAAFCLPLFVLAACGPELEDPDRSYQITVAGVSDTCTGEDATYEAT